MVRRRGGKRPFTLSVDHELVSYTFVWWFGTRARAGKRTVELPLTNTRHQVSDGVYVDQE
jgi:hypothetical protein